MFERLPIQHPGEPPVWLADWPAIDRIGDQFTYSLRRFAINLATKLTSAAVEWNDSQLRTRLAGHMQTWTRTPDGSWRRTCTCGAPPNACPHAYLVYLVLHKVFLDEGWIPAHPESGPAPTGRAPRPVPERRTATATPAPHPAGRAPAGDRTFFIGQEHGASEHTLVAEVDFRHEPASSERVALRCYDQLPAQRELLPLSTLFNLASAIERNGEILGWSPEDQHFLLRLLPELRRIPWKMRNLNVLKVPRDTLKFLQEHWRGDPGRLIERSTQQPLQPLRLETPTAFRVLLMPHDDGQSVTVSGLFTLAGGGTCPATQFFAELQRHPDAKALSAELKRDFNPPFPWTTLFERFGLRDATVTQANLERHLNAVLDGQWELLDGPCVFRDENGEGDGDDRSPTIVAGIESNQFFVEVRPEGGDACDLAHPAGGRPSFRLRHGRLAVRLHVSHTLKEVCNQLLALNGGVYAQSSRRLRLSLTDQNAAQLKALWRRLSALRCRLSPLPELRLLLRQGDQGVSLRPVITLRDRRGPLATIGIEWECGDVRFDTETLRQAASRNTAVFHIGSHWLDIDPVAARIALQRCGDCELDAKGKTLLERRCPDSIVQLQETLGATLAGETRNFLARLAKEPPPEMPAVPARLLDILRPYQRQGVEFLIDRAACGAGAILADDMGLGKTLQLLAVLEAFRERAARAGRPFRALVVCPASVIPCWLEQTRRFCPEMGCAAIAGTPRQRAETIAAHARPLLVTHYALARIDRPLLMSQRYDFLILDEAQAIKNPDAQVTAAVRAIQAEHTIAMTGTPIENSLLDLWSIMGCLNPGLLGDRSDFTSRFVNSGQGAQELRRHLAPLIIRRTKSVVAQDLPERTEQLVMLDMEPEQRQFYDHLLARGKEELGQTGPGAILGLLTRLRQACCHPSLVSPSAKSPSVKLERLLEQLATLNASGHSTLVFSQFASMLALIAERLRDLGIPHSVLTGETPLATRQRLVEDFQNAAEPTNFLLSLKAAGTGLTLTRADYVFIFDPWWNPAAEQQAIDRTHRIGQRNPVVAYRYVTVGTVEENVLTLLQQKRELFSAVLDAGEDGDLASPAKLTMDDLRGLIGC